MRTLVFVSLISAAAIGCAADLPDISEADAPGGKADGSDAADHGCQIVLRTLGQPSGLPGHRVDGVNWVVYEGNVDVADGADGSPMALFSSRSTHGWWQVDAVPVAGGEPGYQRYKFTLDRNTVPMGDSTSWRSMRIEVVPFLATDGGRLFDHNRYPSDFENYTITQYNTHYGDDLAVCH
jgi:hypothetical protein